MEAVYKNHSNLQGNIFFEIQDSIGPVGMWPMYIKCLINSKTLDYKERVKLCPFFYVNGFRNVNGWINFFMKTKGNSFYKYHHQRKDLKNCQRLCQL